MEKKLKFKDCLIKNIKLSEMCLLIQSYEEWRGAEAEESVYDLEDEKDFRDFAEMYGEVTANTYKKYNQFYLAGNAYFTNEEDRSMSRSNKVIPINLMDTRIFYSTLEELEDLYDDYLADYPINQTNLAISIVKDSFKGLIDIENYTRVNYPERFTLKDCILNVEFDTTIKVNMKVMDPDNLTNEEIDMCVEKMLKMIQENPRAYICKNNITDISKYQTI